MFSKSKIREGGYGWPKKWEHEPPPAERSFKKKYILAPFTAFIVDAFRLATLSIYSGILWGMISVPLVFLYNFVTDVSYFKTFTMYIQNIGIYSFLICCFISIVILVPDPIRLLNKKSIVAAIKHGSYLYYEFLISLLIALILFSGSTGFCYQYPFFGLILSIVTGILVGLKVFKYIDDAGLNLWLRIAKTRCLLRMKRTFEVQWLLKSLEDFHQHPIAPPAVENVVKALILHLHRADSGEIKEVLIDAEKKCGKNHPKICYDNIQQTKDMQ
jgi:hypothetical protein